MTNPTKGGEDVYGQGKEPGRPNSVQGTAGAAASARAPSPGLSSYLLQADYYNNAVRKQSFIQGYQYACQQIAHRQQMLYQSFGNSSDSPLQPNINAVVSEPGRLSPGPPSPSLVPSDRDNTSFQHLLNSAFDTTASQNNPVISALLDQFKRVHTQDF
ncbi:hypothetical protein EV182_008161 [Spiromyces aspiralis]|uniref:Uncharacterized protein n=1 Tax=Spiromyces aspiralis TaxID=68401 RepID=A0ACC1HKZ9_9FUNG|nr:hypothetical protein EV182_008161 [Spiromyces aspiralis]